MRTLAFLPSLLVLAACSTTTGPPVSSAEEAAAMEALLEKARVYRLDQIGGLWDMGYRIITKLPPVDAENDEPFIGFLTLDAVPEEARPHAIMRRDSGVVLAHVVAGSAAERAGLVRGDAVVRVNGRKVTKGSQLHDAATEPSRKADRPAEVTLQILRRDGSGDAVTLAPEIPKRLVPFLVMEDEVVNAGTNGSWIGVTRGMFRFADSEDELAVVVGHELAHITKGHLGERAGRGLGWAFAGALISALAGVDLTDVTNVAAAIVESKFGRDQEREADYFGLQYANAAGYDVRGGVTIWERFAIELPESMTKSMFASHPTSAERVVRAQKYAEIVTGAARDTTGFVAPGAAPPPDSPQDGPSRR